MNVPSIASPAIAAAAASYATAPRAAAPPEAALPTEDIQHMGGPKPGFHLPFDPLFYWKFLGQEIDLNRFGHASPDEKHDVVQGLKNIRDFYTKDLGLPADNAYGTGPVKVQFRPGFDNAAYIPIFDKFRFGHLIDEDANGRKFDTGKVLGSESDIVAHEFTHRVVNALNPNLGYRGEAGAVQESIADTMAAAYTKDWTIGEDMMKGGIRNLQEPSKASGQYEKLNERRAQLGRPPIVPPARAWDYVDTKSDSGGAHINANIPNHAAYLIGSQIGTDAMAKIYLDAVRYYMPPNVDFHSEASAVWAAAAKHYGTDSKEAAAVESSWKQVGIDIKDRSLEVRNVLATTS